MKALATELELLRNLVGTLPKRRVLATNQLRPTRRAADQVLAQWDEVTNVPEERLERARREILAAQRTGDDFWSLPVPILRDAVWLLWPEDRDGIDRPRLRRAILDHAETTTSILRRLIDAWLLHFSDDDSFVEVGRQIDRYLATPKYGLLAFWRETHRTFDLFNATGGPAGMASRVLGEPTPSVLTACRLDGPARSVGGFMRAVHLALSAKLPELLTGPNAAEVMERAMRFYVPGEALRFNETQPNGAMADALVDPWIDRQPRLSNHLKSEVLTFLRQHLGDPRVDSRRRWAGASSDTQRTVRAWLSKLSLDAFFNVVGQFAKSAGVDHQWRAREAFWGACLRKEHIEDSWLVLGSNVAGAVSDNRELRGSYARLIDGNPNHSVLLMRIGKLVFAEWSHNGRVRAWPIDWPQAPKLFRANYSRAELVASCLQYPPPPSRPSLGVSGSDGLVHYDGIWQGRVAALLKKREDALLNEQDWAWT